MKNLLLVAAASVLTIAGCASAPNEKAGRPHSAEAPDGAIIATPMASAPFDQSKSLSRIVFASCAQQNEDQSIWDQIASENPELVLYMGDNVYGDVRSNDPSMPELKAAYMRLAESEPFARVRAAAPVLTVWDDHDYGANDGGGDYALKDYAEALFEYVWAVPPDDPRRARDGVYGSWITGEEGRRVQIVMLDTRYFRSPLKRTDEYGARGKERWVPDADVEKTMLGAAQWAWLEEELKKPADLRLLVSSIQVLSEGHGWEAWREFPLERQKLYDTIKRSGADNLIVLSGDRHSAALYENSNVIDYPLFEATSSSLNLPASVWRAQSGETWVEVDPNRLGDMYFEPNYGLIEIDWSQSSIDVSVRSKDGETMLSKTVALTDLQ